MTDQQRKDGHGAIAVLFRAALHPGTVPQSSILEAQTTLSALLEKANCPNTRTLAERIIDRRPCGEIFLTGEDYDARPLGRENGTDETTNQQSPERGPCCTLACVKPTVPHGFYVLHDRSEGIEPSYRNSFGYPKKLGSDIRAVPTIGRSGSVDSGQSARSGDT